ncbi:MAG: Hsp70 family protein, partial [Malacoplasma sp.]|nr:Hsp70 family protein [Malacoplasma sp.]
NKSLGTFTLSGIDPAPRGVPQIQITFNIDANGIMNVTAKDLKNNKEASITIKNSGNLSEEEIDKMVKDAEANKEKDQQAKERTELRYRAESMIAQFEKAMNDEKAKSLPQEQKDAAKKQVEELKTLLKEEKWDELKTKMDQFDQAYQQYAQYAQQAQQGQSSQQEPNTQSTDNTQEVKVEDDSNKKN